MREEKLCRRPSFRPGRAVRLADRQFWTFPAPLEIPRDFASTFGASYEALLEACIEAEDEPERCRAELALAIALLDANYLLETSDFALLLEFDSEDSDSDMAWEALASVASEHLRAFREANVAGAGRDWQAWGLLVRPWKWFGAHSQLAHSSIAERRHAPSRRRPLARESSI